MYDTLQDCRTAQCYEDLKIFSHTSPICSIKVFWIKYLVYSSIHSSCMWSFYKILHQITEATEITLLARAIQSILGPVILNWKEFFAVIIFKLLCKCREYFFTTASSCFTHYYAWSGYPCSFSIGAVHWNEMAGAAGSGAELSSASTAQWSRSGGKRNPCHWQRSCHCLSPPHPHCHPQFPQSLVQATDFELQ